MTGTFTKDLEICFIISTLVYGIVTTIICLTGIFLNCLSIISFILTVKKSKTIYLLIGLELTDSLLLFSIMNLFSINHLMYYTNYSEKNFLYFSTRFILPLYNLSHLMSIWQTVLITFERYLAVCHPMNSKQLSLKFSICLQICIFMIALCLSIVRIWEFEILFLEQFNKWVLKIYLVRISNTYKYYLVFQEWILQLSFPLILIAYMTVSITKVN